MSPCPMAGLCQATPVPGLDKWEEHRRGPTRAEVRASRILVGHGASKQGFTPGGRWCKLWGASGLHMRAACAAVHLSPAEEDTLSVVQCITPANSGDRRDASSCKAFQETLGQTDPHPHRPRPPSMTGTGCTCGTTASLWISRQSRTWSWWRPTSDGSRPGP